MTKAEKSRIALPVGSNLDRFIMRNQEAFPFASGELSQLIRDLAYAGKVVNRQINRAGLADIIGAIGTENVQGEDQNRHGVQHDGHGLQQATDQHPKLLDPGKHPHRLG